MTEKEPYGTFWTIKIYNNIPEDEMTTNQQIERIELLKHRPVLSKQEYHELTGISIPTITRLVLNGKIQARKIGRAVRIINDFNKDA